MENTTASIVLICLQIIPVILFLGAIFAFWNVVNVGPRELPRKHPLNRKMAVPVLVISIGMFMIPIPDLLGTFGILICVFGIIWYAIYFKDARKEYPPMTDADWLELAKTRFGRMRDFNSEDIKEHKEEDK